MGTAALRHVAVAATEYLYSADSDSHADVFDELMVFLGQKYALPLRHMAGLALTTIVMFFRLPTSFGTYCRGSPDSDVIST